MMKFSAEMDGHDDLDDDFDKIDNSSFFKSTTKGPFSNTSTLICGVLLHFPLLDPLSATPALQLGLFQNMSYITSWSIRFPYGTMRTVEGNGCNGNFQNCITRFQLA
ncbi:hypothetical protein AKJ16_DCAP13919 [Drosera capensis]